MAYDPKKPIMYTLALSFCFVFAIHLLLRNTFCRCIQTTSDYRSLETVKNFCRLYIYVNYICIYLPRYLLLLGPFLQCNTVLGIWYLQCKKYTIQLWLTDNLHLMGFSFILYEDNPPQHLLAYKCQGSSHNACNRCFSTHFVQSYGCYHPNVFSSY